MNLFPRRLFPLIVSTAFAIFPIAVNGQDAASAKATFNQVNKHLDLGGQFYGFFNIDGDFQQLAQKANELYTQLQNMEGVGVPPGLDIAGFISELGFDNLKAVGLSSIKFDKGYRNRMFAAIDGERTGLLRLLGGDSKPFEIGEFAPASAAWAMEFDLDLDGVKDLIRGIGGQLEKSMGMDPLSGVLQQPVPGTELNVDQLLDALKGHMLAYIVLDEENSLNIPDPNAPEIPGLDIVLAHDNGEVIFGHIESFITSNAPPDAYTLEENDGVKQLRINLPPPASLGFFAPVIQVDAETNRLIIAARPEAVDTLKEGDRLAADPEFKRIADLLPKEGNGYSYVSPAIYDFMEIFTAAAAQGNPGIAELQGEIMAMIYGKPQVMAGMWANREDGFYSESIAPMSYKLSLAYVAIVPAAMSAAIVAPMAAQSRRRAMEMQRQAREAEARVRAN